MAVLLGPPRAVGVPVIDYPLMKGPADLRVVLTDGRAKGAEVLRFPRVAYMHSQPLFTFTKPVPLPGEGVYFVICVRLEETPE